LTRVFGWVADLSTDRARLASAPFRRCQCHGALLGACALGLAITLAMASSPATAQAPLKWKATLNHKQTEHLNKEPFGDIPKGPLQIIVSINEQQLHLYSNGTHVADALIATGVAARPTPMGVFSVIEKERFHRSNIYSGAPMPYMQRITWSGVAMHEGVNLGHPASHGCIRLPREFAERLFLLHSVGARVFIARPELRPIEFTDPHLFVHKDRPSEPAPSARAPAPVEVIKTAQTVDDSRTTDAIAPVAELRTSFAGTDSAKPVGAAAAESAIEPNNQVAAVEPADPVPARAEDGKNAPADSAALNEVGDRAATLSAAIQSKRAAASQPTRANETAAQAPAKQPAVTDAAETGRPDPAAPDAGAKPPRAAALEAVPMPFAKPAQLAKVAAAKHAPITIFISRKAGKIYVRQNFTPLFEAPVTVDQPQRPFGTHVFTAMQYLDDGATMRWNVVSLPGEPPNTARTVQKQPAWSPKGKQSRESAAKPLVDPPSPQMPQEALARIQIPQEVIDQISQMIVPGSSLIVSDQGLGEETGEGTDFIVVTR
jgi:hypothetical protein